MSDSTARSQPKVSASEFRELIRLFEAWQALKLLGWQEPRYFKWPPDGTEFELIELGSTGIHRAVTWSGKRDCVWVDRDWPSHPFLVREVRRSSDV